MYVDSLEIRAADASAPETGNDNGGRRRFSLPRQVCSPPPLIAEERKRDAPSWPFRRTENASTESASKRDKATRRQLGIIACATTKCVSMVGISNQWIDEVRASPIKEKRRRDQYQMFLCHLQRINRLT